jgi:hypothetical protein
MFLFKKKKKIIINSPSAIDGISSNPTLLLPGVESYGSSKIH